MSKRPPISFPIALLGLTLLALLGLSLVYWLNPDLLGAVTLVPIT